MKFLCSKLATFPKRQPATTIPVPSISSFAVRSLNQIKAVEHVEVMAQVVHDTLKTFKRGCEMNELR